MIKFGVAGNSQSFFDEGYTDTLSAALWCKNRDIDAFEYSFGNGVRISQPTAELIGREFSKQGVELSVHAPYFINFSNPDPDMAMKSVEYVLQSAKKLAEFGGNRLVIHPATQGKATREEAVAVAASRLAVLGELVRAAGHTDIKLCLETMGKQGQIGTVDEIISFCNLDPQFYPCIDFGHVNAREQGILKGPGDYRRIIDRMLSMLPSEKVKHMHVHFSKIQYGAKGEIRHLTFADTEYGPCFEHLAPVISEYALEPYVICESSGTQAEDAIQMKKLYFGA